MYVLGTGILCDKESFFALFGIENIEDARNMLKSINETFLIHENSIEKNIFITMQDACSYMETIEITTVSKFESVDLENLSTFMEYPIEIVLFIVEDPNND